MVSLRRTFVERLVRVTMSPSSVVNGKFGRSPRWVLKVAARTTGERNNDRVSTDVHGHRRSAESCCGQPAARIDVGDPSTL